MTTNTENPSTAFWVSHRRPAEWTCQPASTAVRDFHRSLPGYTPTPLLDLPPLAAELGVGRVLIKDESDRLGLPAFKALGASWAVHRIAREHSGATRLTLVAATDGNHGRAVARFARLLGHQSRIYVPTAVHPTQIQSIADEGATVTTIDGSYDDTVAVAARACQTPDTVLVQDTAWEGYEDIPSWIVEGYDTLFAEIDEQLDAIGVERPDLVAVPTGVGSLLQAAITHYRSHPAPSGTAVVSVEPQTAACVAASIAAGRPTTLDTTPTAMAGLNCGTPSYLAWPIIASGLDAAITVSEEADIRAAHDLGALGIAAGPCGAAPLAALRAALTGPGSGERREHVQIGGDSTVILLCTEGSSTNPVPDLPTPHV